MDNRGQDVEIRTERRSARNNEVQDLHLDNVVSSQPEIGPTPPDGGYGWLIVFSAALYNVTVPSLLSLYGIVILNALKQEDHDEDEKYKIWEMDIALVPVIMIVIKLLLESWCRAVVKTFHMPRFMALSGLCLTVAGVLLSSYSTDVYSNDHIANVFAGIFAGMGYALTDQQTNIIVTHYFREKLTIAQRIVRMAPSIGNCLVPLLVGFLCTQNQNHSVVMIYSAIVMQNCFFLASYTRPVYIEKVIRTTYNMLRDAVEDEDEVIFSNQRNRNDPETGSKNEEPIPTQDDDVNDVVVFNSKKGAKEIFDPEVEYREKNPAPNRANTPSRFSSDFSSIFAEGGASNRFSSNFGSQEIEDYERTHRRSITFADNPNRFSSNFGSQDIFNYNPGSRTLGYQELENIDSQNPQPLYRETTTNAPENTIFPEATPGTIRRTAALKKNFITITNMLLDINFYLYALLHLSTTFSILVLGVFFPVFIWEQNQSMTIWSVSTLVAVAHASAFCFIMLCVVMPQSINEKARLCAGFCLVGALGFYGITLSSNKNLLVVWCMCASFSTAASSILQQPLYNSTLNEFNTTATITANNLIAAAFILAWCLVRNFEYITCFMTASILQVSTAVIFFVMSFRRRR